MLSKPVPSTSCEPVNNKPPTQEGEQTSQESTRASKGWDLTRLCWKMLTVMEGPKFEDTDSSAVLQ